MGYSNKLVVKISINLLSGMMHPHVSSLAEILINNKISYY